MANVAAITVIMKAQAVPIGEAHRRMDEAIADAGPESVIKDAEDVKRVHNLISSIYAGDFTDPAATADAAFAACMRSAAQKDA